MNIVIFFYTMLVFFVLVGLISFVLFIFKGKLFYFFLTLSGIFGVELIAKTTPMLKEISTSLYKILSQDAKKYPQLKPDLQNAYSDGKITTAEWLIINEKITKLKEEETKKELQEQKKNLLFELYGED